MTIEVQPYSVIYGLPRAEWRGLVAPPYDVAGFSFSHRQTEQQYYGIGGASHRHAGMNTTPMHFKLYFLNTLEAGLFPARWNDWQVALFDGKAGKLKHPLRGTIDAVVLSGDVQLEARTTAGIIVEVHFSDTILDPTKAQGLATVKSNYKTLASAAKDAIQNPDINLPTQESTMSLLDILDQIDSWIYSTELSAQGQINQWQARIDDWLDIIQGKAPGTSAWVAGDLLIGLWGALEDTKNTIVANQSRPTASGVAPSNTTIDSIARERDNSVQDFMGLNLQLLQKSWVPRGTPYRYYTG